MFKHIFIGEGYTKIISWLFYLYFYSELEVLHLITPTNNIDPIQFQQKCFLHSKKKREIIQRLSQRI